MPDELSARVFLDLKPPLKRLVIYAAQRRFPLPLLHAFLPSVSSYTVQDNQFFQQLGGVDPKTTAYQKSCNQ